MNDIPDLPVYGFDTNLGGLLSFVIAIALPVLAALLTRQSWPAKAKGTVLLVLAFAKMIVEAWLEATNRGVRFDWLAALWSTGYNFAIAVVAYFGVLRTTDTLAAAQRALVKDRS